MKKVHVVTVKNKVILNSIQDLQRLPLQLVNSLRGRSRIKYGMTLIYNGNCLVRGRFPTTFLGNDNII